MTLVSFITLCVSLTAALCLAAVNFMHYFQLNSYKFAEHKEWLVRNVGRLCLLAILSAAVGLCALIGGVLGLFSAAALTVLYALAAKPKSAKSSKKPIVFTARVKRMLATEALLAVGFFAALSLLMPTRLAPIWAGVVLLFLPYLNLAANIINAPIEKAICNYYINDAKKMLAAHKSLKVVGVTGSYGKTGTKYALTALLSEKYDVLMTPASYNTPMGVVKTVRSSLRATNEIFVCEMGAKYVGDINELCEIVDPELAIITSVGEQHLLTFGGLDNIVKTKFEIADYLKNKNCPTVVGYDNENIKKELLRRGTDGFVRCGSDENADFRVSDVSADERGTSFTLTLADGESVRLTVALLGAHNVSNIACAAAAAYKLGMSLDEIRLAARKIRSAPHRLEMSRRGRDILIDDAYNANPAGTRAALDALSLFEGCRIIITPGMVELGTESEDFNYRLGSDAAKICDHILLVGERQTRPIAKGAADVGISADRLRVFERVEDAINYAFSLSSDGRKIVLLENDLPDNY